jgi:hypothetical protein
VQAVAGIALGVIMPRATKVYLPLPVKWRGSVPKAILHERILERVGKPPTALQRMTVTERGNVIDAMGLALWAMDTHRWETRVG